jgi:hypothetical protein
MDVLMLPSNLPVGWPVSGSIAVALVDVDSARTVILDDGSRSLLVENAGTLSTLPLLAIATGSRFTTVD